jgi:hypothetical protein
MLAAGYALVNRLWQSNFLPLDAVAGYGTRAYTQSVTDNVIFGFSTGFQAQVKSSFFYVKSSPHPSYVHASIQISVPKAPAPGHSRHFVCVDCSLVFRQVLITPPTVPLRCLPDNALVSGNVRFKSADNF